MAIKTRLVISLYCSEYAKLRGKKLKIAYIITRSDVIGGASVHVLDLAEGARNAGHDVTIYVGGEGVFFIKAEALGLRCISLTCLVREINIGYDIRAFFELREALKLLRPDLVHLHSSKAGILGRLAAKSLNLPTIFTAHGWAFTEGVSPKRRWLYRIIEKVMALFSDKIITVSDFDRQLALNSGIGNKELISTVHNGVSVNTASGYARTASESVRLIMVARFEHPKNHIFLLEALARLKSKLWQLELVGDGPLFNSVKDSLIRLELTDRVTLSGACDDVPQRLAVSDIFVLISDWEGLPLTILEAMRSEMPVIASAVGGVPELVNEGENGFLVPRGDQDILVSALSRLIDSSALRRGHGKCGRKKFEAYFTFDIMLRRTLEIYKSVIDQKK